MHAVSRCRSRHARNACSQNQRCCPAWSPPSVQLAVAQALSVLQNDPSGLTAHYLQKALNNLATANSARYICIKNAVLKVMCDSQFNDEGRGPG